MRSVSFFKGRQSDYMGMDDPKLEELVRQWRRSPGTQQASGHQCGHPAPAGRAAVLGECRGVSLLPGAYRTKVKGYPFYDQALSVPGIDLAGQVIRHHGGDRDTRLVSPWLSLRHECTEVGMVPAPGRVSNIGGVYMKVRWLVQCELSDSLDALGWARLGPAAQAWRDVAPGSAGRSHVL